VPLLERWEMAKARKKGRTGTGRAKRAAPKKGAARLRSSKKARAPKRSAPRGPAGSARAGGAAAKRTPAGQGPREIESKKIADAVARLSMEANFELEADVEQAIARGLRAEESPVGREIFGQLIENSRIARTERLPICQDTGLAVIFADIGQDIRIVGGGFEEAVNAGVRRGYTEAYLRKSVLGDPLRRVNTKDNTPAVIHARIVPGRKIRLWVVPKGGGSENKSRIAMLKPADGVEGVKRFVVESVKIASADPCPPVVVGVGIGGSFEQCAMNAKRALLREIGSTHPDPFYADLEKELYRLVNDLGIGPMGLGGRITALAVHIEAAPCHIASLPAAVNMNCHAARHKTVEL
jgi:fumarate hydratase subunit alpha